MTQTIIGIATPAGAGAIAIIRMSGENALDIALRLCKKNSLEPRNATLSYIYDSNGAKIDQAIIIYFKSPHSYTGEDIVEIHTHGGFVCAQAVVERAFEVGAEIANFQNLNSPAFQNLDSQTSLPAFQNLAQNILHLAKPGEFTKRALLNDKLDLSQAQAVNALINSQSKSAAQMLVRQLSGELGEFVNDMRDKLLEILAYSEANIDYAEEMESATLEAMGAKIEQIQQNLRVIYDDSIRRKGIVQGYRICIVGKPNVGKSSLLNALLSNERAIVSDIEGTTRDTIEESINIGGVIVRLIDTAGIRASSDNIENIGIQRSIAAMSEANIIIALFDAHRALDSQDFEILEMIKRQEKNVLFVANKSDLGVEKNTYSELLSALNCENFRICDEILMISSTAGSKFTASTPQKIIDVLASFFGTQAHSEAMLLTSDYQISCVKNAQDCINLARNKLENGELELFSYHINDAIAHICAITKPFEYSQMLDKMFGEFCLGK